MYWSVYYWCMSCKNDDYIAQNQALMLGCEPG